MRAIMPDDIHPPFAAYSHGIVAEVSRLLLTSGQLGIAPDGAVPEGAEAQADLCFSNIAAVLREAGMDKRNILRINAYVSGREHMAGYREARDRYVADLPDKPASTLLIVSGFTRPEFLVEVEVLAGV